MIKKLYHTLINKLQFLITFKPFYLNNITDIEKKFFTELVSKTYDTKDSKLISDKIKSDLKEDISYKEIDAFLEEDYELESRKMEFSLSMRDIF